MIFPNAAAAAESLMHFKVQMLNAFFSLRRMSSFKLILFPLFIGEFNLQSK